MRKIIDIINNNLCLGCGLCQSIDDKCQMHLSKSGFYEPFPISDDKDINSKIVKLCPAINVIDNSKENNVWGHVEKSHVAWSSDPAIRKSSSSGGLISSLLIYLLENKKVDGVLQVGSCDFIHNKLYVNCSKDEILKCNNSRYAPALVFSDIFQILKQDGIFAFVGKPCDVAVIRNLQTVYPYIKSKIPYLISLFCAGIPSINATMDVLKCSGRIDDPINIRYRGEGWPGLFRAQYKNNEFFTMSYNESWGKVLGRQLAFRCKICPDGVGLLADISTGDAWCTKDGYPDFEERDGRNICLIRTKVGEDIFNNALNSGYIQAEQFNILKAKDVQPFQYYRRCIVGWRVFAVQLMTRNILNFKGLKLYKLTKEKNIKICISEFIGTLRRFKKIHNG